METVIEQEKGIRNVTEYKAILTAIASGDTERNQIATRIGEDDEKGYAFRTMLSRLEALGYIEKSQNFDAKPNAPYRYRIMDPALHFFHRFVLKFRNEFETGAAEEVWDRYLLDELNRYMGKPIFEVMARQAYTRLRSAMGLPMVKQWGYWEGQVKPAGGESPKSEEMDIVARLSDGRVLTGAVKWNRSPISPRVHRKHLRDLSRLAESGVRWAYQAREEEAPLIYFAAGGFEGAFREQAEESGHPILLVTLEDMYERVLST